MSGALDDIFQSIYSSVVEAQNTIESHYLGEIVDDYFEKDGTPKVCQNERFIKYPHPFSLKYNICKRQQEHWDGDIICKNPMTKELVKMIMMDDKELEQYSGSCSAQQYRTKLIHSIAILYD